MNFFQKTLSNLIQPIQTTASTENKQTTNTKTKDTNQSKQKRILSEWEEIDRSRNTTRLEGTAVEVFVEEELRYNILTNEFELKGKDFNIKVCQSEIYEHYNVDCSIYCLPSK